MHEFWRPVVGFEGFYEVSDLGRVRSVNRTVATHSGALRFYRGKLLKLRPNVVGGHLYVSLKKQGKHFTPTVHSLVLAAFVGPRPEGLQCCHGPKGKTCNELNNLSWGTPLKNSGEDKRRDDALLFGERHQNHKISSEQVKSIRADTRCRKRIALEHGISPSYVSALKAWQWRKRG